MDQTVPSERQPAEHAHQLVSRIALLPNCIVAFSGGVDSAVVAKAAHLALGDRAVAVTGTSVSLASGELEEAQATARAIGIRHETVTTGEINSAGYQQNAPDRCWHCKNELYQQLGIWAGRHWADHQQSATILSGDNADDLSDFRPGLRAADEHQIRSPLAECGLGKVDVRRLAHHWQLAIWNKPATPCLSSRVVYGLEVTPERLARIDAAEQFLRELGFTQVRVRHHQGDLARIELSTDQITRLKNPRLTRKIATKLGELGFRYITVDLEGFRSGSFHQLIPEDQLHSY